ncbi:MAG: RagB/SusD family nutrient uptake outer membrane protein, partial [Chitinophaga rupis]
MKYTAYIYAAVGLLLSFSSCKKYLDQKPDNLLTEDQLWQTRANAEAYLYNMYSLLHNTDGGDCPNMGASDETSVSIPTVDVRQMVGGNWSPQSTISYNWGSYYAGIRQSFVFEQNIDKVPSSQLSDSLKLQYKSESIFLRGWFFLKLLRQ